MKILMNTLLALTLLAVACKKDKDNGPQGINGEYTVYEIEQQNPLLVTPMPNTKGDNGKFTVTLVGTTEATIRFQLLDKDKKPLVDQTYNCNLKKDADGDIFLTQKSDNANVAFFYDNELDFYAVKGFRIGGRR